MSETFGIQFFDDYSDYPRWEDVRDWDAGNRPLRFASPEEAEAFLDAEHEAWFVKAHAAWMPRKARYDEGRDLHARRRDCLIEHGLWKQDGESFVPLLGVGGPGHEPSPERDRSSHRIVPDCEMNEPVEVTA